MPSSGHDWEHRDLRVSFPPPTPAGQTHSDPLTLRITGRAAQTLPGLPCPRAALMRVRPLGGDPARGWRTGFQHSAPRTAMPPLRFSSGPRQAAELDKQHHGCPRPSCADEGPPGTSPSAVSSLLGPSLSLRSIPSAFSSPPPQGLVPFSPSVLSPEGPACVSDTCFLSPFLLHLTSTSVTFSMTSLLELESWL